MVNRDTDQISSLNTYRMKKHAEFALRELRSVETNLRLLLGEPRHLMNFTIIEGLSETLSKLKDSMLLALQVFENEKAPAAVSREIIDLSYAVVSKADTLIDMTREVARLRLGSVKIAT